MSKRKFCPLKHELKYCAGDDCQWWHGDMCDMSRLTAQMTVMPAIVQRLAGDTNASELENAVMRSAEIFSDEEVPE